MGKPNPIKWSYNMVKEYIEKEGYTLVNKEYIRKKDKLEMICPNGHKINLSFDCFSKGVRCGECYREKPRVSRRQTLEEVKHVVESVEGYELLSIEYDPSKKIKIRHNCGNEYEVTLNNFKKGRRCPICQLKREEKRIKEDYVIKNINNEGYEIISLNGFNKSSDKIKLKCPKGHVYEASWNAFQQGKRCPYCKSSKGENKVKDYLDSKNIIYYQQYRFEDCKNNRGLPFDFYLPQYNTCIEYDGKQHYELINFSGNMTMEEQKDRLEYCKQNDNIKTKYCKDNNIKLIRIPYWEFDNIENILIKEI